MADLNAVPPTVCGVHLGLLKGLRGLCLTLVWAMEETLDLGSEDLGTAQDDNG